MPMGGRRPGIPLLPGRIRPVRDAWRGGALISDRYRFERFLRPSASFSANPSFWAIFFLASE